MPNVNCRTTENVQTTEIEESKLDLGRPPKLLLINPPKRVFIPRTPYSRWFPLGLAYLAGYVRSRGFSVRVFDSLAFCEDSHVVDKETAQSTGLGERPGVSTVFHLGASRERLWEALQANPPDLVGISCLMTAHRAESIELSRLVKSYRKDIPVVFGGADASVAAQEILAQEKSVDFVIRGDGEFALAELMEALTSHGSLEAAPGLVFRKANGCHVSPYSYMSEDDLNKLDPATDLFPMERWFQAAGMRFWMLSASRGCSQRCTFCSQRLTPFRRRSIESVVREIDGVTRKFQIDHLLFEDDMLLSDREWAIELFEAIESLPSRYRIHCFSGVAPQKMDRRIASAMRRAGVSSLPFGWETSNATRRRKLLKSSVAFPVLKKAVATARQAGIHDVRVFLIGGLPESTLEDCLDDIEAVYRLGARANLNSLYPLPGTPLFEEVKRKGYLVSSTPSRFRAAYANIDSSAFPRRQLLACVDAYHALKTLASYSGLDECLQEAGVTIVSSDRDVSVYKLVAERCECTHIASEHGLCGWRHCLHFAKRLASWFSLAHDAVFAGEETACRLAGESSTCRFVLRRNMDGTSTEAFILKRFSAILHSYEARRKCIHE